MRAPRGVVVDRAHGVTSRRSVGQGGHAGGRAHPGFCRRASHPASDRHAGPARLRAHWDRSITREEYLGHSVDLVERLAARDRAAPALHGIEVLNESRWADAPFNHALQPMDASQESVALRAYGVAQLLAFENCRGWFFWSYRTETKPAWCFRECVERGWLPP